MCFIAVQVIFFKKLFNIKKDIEWNRKKFKSNKITISDWFILLKDPYQQIYSKLLVIVVYFSKTYRISVNDTIMSIGV